MRQMKLKDSRLRLMNEVLEGIKVLKLYAWDVSSSLLLLLLLLLDYLFSLYVDASDEAEGFPSAADERGPGGHQGPEAVRLGELLPGQDPGDQEPGARYSQEVRLPECCIIIHFFLCSIPGKPQLFTNGCL